MALLIRWVFAFLLVAATYNPTDYNYVRWSIANSATDLPLVALLGILLFICYVVFLRATLRSIGAFGMILVLALVGTLVWVLQDYGLLSLQNTSAMVWLGVAVVSFVLAVGLSWSFIRRALSGQVDVDDADN